jgi:peroxiredoxin
MHDAGVWNPRPPGGLREGRRKGRRRLPGHRHRAEEVRRQVRPRLHPLGDEHHQVAELYGVWGEKKTYGKTYMGVQRATFIIDPEGKVAHVIPKATPKTHDDVVLGALSELASA